MRLGHLIEDGSVTCLARTDSIDPDNVLAPPQAASSTYRIAAESWLDFHAIDCSPDWRYCAVW